MSETVEKANECVMYILVNESLKMGKGKTAGQCCHAACRVTRILCCANELDVENAEWLSRGEPKIVVKASEQLMIKLCEKYSNPKSSDSSHPKVWCCDVRDMGKTQIPANSLTAIAFRPLRRSELPPELASQKLLN